MTRLKSGRAVFGDYLRPHVFSSEQERSSFFIFLATGATLGAALLVALAFAAAQRGLPAGTAIAVWVVFGLLTMWWILTVVAASWRRLRNADADPWLALVWPFLPVAAAVGASWPMALNGLQILKLPFDAMLVTITLCAGVFSGGLLVFLLVVCASPAGAWRWPEARLMFWVTVAYVPLVALAGWLAGKVLRRIIRPNLGTRLGLLASFIALCALVAAENLESATRSSALIAVGLIFTAFHLLRWILQERHFSVRRVKVDFAGDQSFQRADPRWRRWPATVFKVLGVVWIWTVIVGAIPRTSDTMTIVWVVLWTGFLIYLVAPAIPAGFGTIFLVAATWSFDADQAFRGFAAPLLVLWGISAVYFGLIWFFVPADGRYNFTRDFHRHLSASEW